MSRVTCRATATLVAVSLSLSVARGEDSWPEFRGPTGQGHATASGLPEQWAPDKNVRWRQELPGAGWSSPVVFGGRVYLTAAVPEAAPATGTALSLLICDLESGRLAPPVRVFEERPNTPKIHGKNSHASPTPIVHDGRVYVHFGHEGTACLDLDGRQLWENRELSYPPVHGNGGSPAICGDVLVYSADGASAPQINALGLDDGKLRWQFARPTEATKKFSFTTPLLIDEGGRATLLSPGSDMLTALDPATGRERWRVRYTGYSVIPRPVVGHGMVYISTSYDSPSVMAIRLGGEGDVTDSHVAWTRRQGAPHTPSLLLDGDELYMVSDKGIATCVDAVSGEEIWQERIGGNFSASPLLADGRIYLLSEEGDAYVLRAGRSYELLAKNTLGERTLASPAAVGHALLIRTQNALYRLENSR